MKTLKLLLAFVLLAISQFAVAQVTTAQIREQIAKGECETAQSLYNVYKAMNGTNNTIEREIADCKNNGADTLGGDYGYYLQKARQRLAEGDCDRAQISYNVYKDLSKKTDKSIEREIAECGGNINSLGDDSRTGSTKGHDYVDLGLPSGTFWATCNLGANIPEEHGNYYAWGETDTKTIYNWETYKYANGDYNKLTKYCGNSDFGNNGFTDNLTALQRGDDPATANWGSGWRTPSKAQWEELKTNTTQQWTTRGGKRGMLFTSKKNNQTLFLPAAGRRRDGEVDDVGFYGFYWSRSLLTTGRPSDAWYLYLDFNSGGCGMGNCYLLRGNGFSVRPVYEK